MSKGFSRITQAIKHSLFSLVLAEELPLDLTSYVQEAVLNLCTSQEVDYEKQENLVLTIETLQELADDFQKTRELFNGDGINSFVLEEEQRDNFQQFLLNTTYSLEKTLTLLKSGQQFFL